ncbi:ATP-dependent DNA helicase Q-like 3 [Verticillium longisporum]|nr:ATP-dependent DNA helicase Q-like 3 [Verticillium longisporum]
MPPSPTDSPTVTQAVTDDPIVSFTADTHEELLKTFKKQSFRPQQREIITAALDGNDSYLVYKLDALTSRAPVTIVVSPLLSLMMNQVEQLQAAGIKASSYNSNTRPEEKDRINRDLASGHPRTRLLYVTPELCSSESFRNRLKLVHQQCELARIAIDEAHCISEWGHDFRKDFKRLSS